MKKEVVMLSEFGNIIATVYGQQTVNKLDHIGGMGDQKMIVCLLSGILQLLLTEREKEKTDTRKRFKRTIELMKPKNDDEERALKKLMAGLYRTDLDPVVEPFGKGALIRLLRKSRFLPGVGKKTFSVLQKIAKRLKEKED